MLHKVHPGSNTGMYFVVLYHSLARICRKTVVKLNHQTGRNAGISGASGQCSGPAVADEQYIYHRFELLLQVVMYRLYHREAGVPIVRYSRNAQGVAALSAAASLTAGKGGAHAPSILSPDWFAWIG